MSNPHCINTRATWFKNMAKKFNVSEAKLDDIMHAYQYLNDTDEIPSDAYILDKLQGLNNEYSDEAMTIWGTKYAVPLVFTSEKDLNRAVQEATRFFPKEAIVTFKNNRDEYIIKVARPQNPNSAIVDISKISPARRDGYNKGIEKELLGYLTTLYPEIDLHFSEERITQLARKTIQDYEQEYPTAREEANKMSIDEARQILRQINRKGSNFRFQVSKARQKEFWNRLANNPNIDADWVVEGDELVPLLPKECVALLKYLDTLNNKKYEDTVFKWYMNGTINIEEDNYKIQYALQLIDRKGVNPRDFKSPVEVINAFPSDEVKANRESIKVGKEFDIYRNCPYLSNETVEGEYVVYDVEDSEESARYISENIIAKYFNKSPWCIFKFSTPKDSFGGLGRGNSNILNPVGSGLMDNNHFPSWNGENYWRNYSFNKERRIAIDKRGIPAFMKASANNTEEWWDAINDAPCKGPDAITYKPTGDGRTAVWEKIAHSAGWNRDTEASEQIVKIFKGSLGDGDYIEWTPDGKTITKIQHKVGHKLHGEQWDKSSPNTKTYYHLGQLVKKVTSLKGGITVTSTYENTAYITPTGETRYRSTIGEVKLDKGNSSISVLDVESMPIEEVSFLNDVLSKDGYLGEYDDVENDIDRAVSQYYTSVDDFKHKTELHDRNISLPNNLYSILDRYRTEPTWDILEEISHDVNLSMCLSRTAVSVFSRLRATSANNYSQDLVLQGTGYKSINQFLGHLKSRVLQELKAETKAKGRDIAISTYQIRRAKMLLSAFYTIQESESMSSHKDLLDKIAQSRGPEVYDYNVKKIKEKEKRREKQLKKAEELRDKIKKRNLKKRAQEISTERGLSTRVATYLAELESPNTNREEIRNNIEEDYRQHNITEVEYNEALTVINNAFTLDELFDIPSQALDTQRPFPNTEQQEANSRHNELENRINEATSIEQLEEIEQILDNSIPGEIANLGHLRTLLGINHTRMLSVRDANYASLQREVNNLRDNATQVEYDVLRGRIQAAYRMNLLSPTDYSALITTLEDREEGAGLILPFQVDEDEFNVLGVSNLEAMSVLIDAVRQKQDTLPHEYAHHYIGWYRHTKVVQDAIKSYGSEEALVQAIGENVADRAKKGNLKARTWWKKICDYILNIFRKDKRQLEYLTDAFLTKKALNDYKILENSMEYQDSDVVSEKIKLSDIFKDTGSDYRHGGVYRENGHYYNLATISDNSSTTDTLVRKTKEILEARGLNPDDYEYKSTRILLSKKGFTKKHKAIEVTPKGTVKERESKLVISQRDKNEATWRDQRDRAFIERNQLENYYNDDSAPRFNLEKVQLKRKESWLSLRGGAIIANLPNNIRDLVARDIESYMKAKSEGVVHISSITDYVGSKNQTTASQVLDRIIKTSSDSTLVELAKIAKKNLKKDVEVIYDPSNSSTRGLYGTDGKVYIYNNASKGNTTEESKLGVERTLIHEIIHSITVGAIESNESLRKDIAEVMGQLKDYLEQNKIDTTPYALKNVAEFIAEFMSQPLLRESLKQMQYKPKESFLKKIWNTILNHLGVSTSSTLFDRTEEIFNDILNSEASDIVTQEYRDSAEKPRLNIPEGDIKKQFDIRHLDSSKCEVTYHKEPWKDDSTKTKYSCRVYLKGQKEKGCFEIVVDTDFENTKFNGEYSVHFKTSTDKNRTDGIIPSTSDERNILYSQVRQLIPAGAKISTWGELTPGGKYALEKLGKEWNKTGEIREVKYKDGRPLKIPIFEKPKTQDMNSTQLFLERQHAVKSQMMNLFTSTKFTNAELGHIADNIVYAVSNMLTEVQNNPNNINNYFKNKEVSTDAVASAKDRVALVNAIGVSNIINWLKSTYANTTNEDGTPRFTNLRTARKAQELSSNWDAIMQLTVSRFNQIEGFTLVKDIAATKEVDEIQTNSDEDYNTNTDLDAIREMQGDLQEAWQVDAKTIDAIKFMTSQVKSKLDGIPVLKITGFDEDNSPITEEVKDEFGGTERRTLGETVQTLLTWFQGTQNMSDMIKVLQSKQKSNPWVLSILPLLQDTTGEYSYFQSEFFTVMYRPFQNYDVISKNNKGKYKAGIVNKETAASNVIKSIKAMMNIGEHPLFTNGINANKLANFEKCILKLKEYSEASDKNAVLSIDKLHNTIGYMYTMLGFQARLEDIQQAISPDTISKLISPLEKMLSSMKKHIGDSTYDPFEWQSDSSKPNDCITGNLKAFLKPVTDILTETTISSFYDSGKMYQSYVIPSYMTNMVIRLKDNSLNENGIPRVADYIDNEFGKYPWFHIGDDMERGWRNSWLRELYNNPEARKVFDHKINLNMNKNNYMKNMSPLEYTISCVVEFFAEGVNTKNPRCPSWFRVPILSNKPSSEFIKFFSERINYKETLTNNMLNVFNQELSRIQTVRMRNLSKSDPAYIKSFDERGKKFCFLDFLNAEIVNETELGKLIQAKIEGKELGDKNARLLTLIKESISSNVDRRVSKIIEKWKSEGVVDACIKSIEGFNKTNAEELCRMMLWNDTYAQMMIQELMITDPAYYKDADDIQKRIAQIHAPGIRPNLEARYPKQEGKLEAPKVTDGIQRNIVVADFDKVKSSTYDNIKEVFDRKIAEAPDNMKAQWETLKENVLSAYAEINVADAQAYCSMTAYRKKAMLFGKWNDKSEKIYQKLLKGEYTFTDLQTAFQPLKPFMYSQNEENMGVDGPLTTHKMPVQNKNAEYLLIMADALTRNEKLSRPNLLRILNDVMEESHYDRDAQGNIINIRPDGIDTIQFDSAVKCGNRGSINLNSFTQIPEGEKIEDIESAAKVALLSHIYTDLNTHSYNMNHVNHSNYENYSIQQEVPEHFRNHSQAHGSQERFIIPSDLADTMIVDGKEVPAIYEFKEADGTVKTLTKEQFKKEYEETIAANINEDILTLVDKFKLENSTPRERKEALSRIIQEEVESSSRYGIDLWLASCINDVTGDFEIPLGDPIQAKRIEQLLNSVIKNKVNKQKLPGGPVVQISNFGMSKALHTRYKDRLSSDPNAVCMTKEEFAQTWKPTSSSADKFNAKFGKFTGNKSTSKSLDESYSEYLKEHQGGIAYHECFAPIPSEDFFDKFADENGNIDIKAIEATNPELLYMISNRIPTEDKYSIEVIKIVGFLPREAGEAICLPYDITSRDGSDFDVDKRYVQRKKIPITLKPINQIKEAMKAELTDYINQHYEGEEAKDKIRGYLSTSYIYELSKNTETRIRDYKNTTDRKQAETNKFIHSLFRRVAYKADAPTTGRAYRDNKIIDMTRTVMQHPTQSAASLTPQSFDREKKIGYAIEAFRRNLNTWNTLINKSSKELKSMLGSGDNLIWLDTQIQYYAQNASASTILGMFAVQKIAHAALEGDGIRVDVGNMFAGSENKGSSINIAESVIDRNTEFDKSVNPSGESIGLTFASHVGASADAAKDPFLSLMNINSSTVGVLSTMIKAGMPYQDCAIFLSSNVIKEMIQRSDINNLSGNSSLYSEVKDELDTLTEEVGGSIGKLAYEPLSRVEMLEAIRLPYAQIPIETKIKTLNYYQMLSSVATELKSATMATRFNSISSAVGPLIIDNLMTEYNISNFSKYLLNAEGKKLGFYDIMDMHPILSGFERTVDLAKGIFGNMPTNSHTFRTILNELVTRKELKSLGNSILTDRELLNKFSNFWQSYLLIESGAVDSKNLDYYINKFVSSYISNKAYKVGDRYESISEHYPNNVFVQNTKLRTTSKGSTYLNVETTGIQQADKDILISGWIDLYNAEEKLNKSDEYRKKLNEERAKRGLPPKNVAMDLFNYYYFRRGIGFNPETGMGLFPMQLKLKFNKYLETFRKLPTVDTELLIDQFIRNNADNNKLVPFRGEKFLKGFEVETDKNTKLMSLWSGDKSTIENFMKLTYFKFSTGGSIHIMKRVYSDGIAFEEVTPLGNNGEYMEISTSDITKSLADRTYDALSNNGEPSEVQNEEQAFSQDTPQEAQQETLSKARMNRLISLFPNAKDPSQAPHIWKEALTNPDKVKADLALQKLRKVLQRNLPKIGEQVTEENIQKTIKDLNLC